MAHKKGASSTRNGRDSNAQRLGVKRFGGQQVKAGDLLAVVDPRTYKAALAQAEAAVRAVYPDAVILRPSLVFGAGDNFLNRFAAMATMAPALPLIGGGETRFQPVYVDDVAAAAAGAGDGEAHLVVDIHERHRARGVGAGAGDERAARAQRAEFVADAAAGLQGQAGLVDLLQDPVHRVGDGARDGAVDRAGGRLVLQRAGIGGDAAGRDRAAAQRPQEALVPVGLLLVGLLGVGQGAGHALVQGLGRLLVALGVFLLQHLGADFLGRQAGRPGPGGRAGWRPCSRRRPCRGRRRGSAPSPHRAGRGACRLRPLPPARSSRPSSPR